MADTENESGKLTGDQVAEMDDLDDWRPVLGALRSRFATGDFETGLKLTAEIAKAAEKANHHPDVDLRYPHVDVTLSSHDVGGMTERDVDLARRISEIAAKMDVEAEPAAVTVVEIGLDTWDEDKLRPFWAAVLGADESNGELVDGSAAVPTLWFQDTDQHEEPRQRFHLDVWVPADQAESRIKAAVDAGGTVVSDEEAPAFVVLADAHGNKACICTSASRTG